jgi:hypothetical protein
VAAAGQLVAVVFQTVAQAAQASSYSKFHQAHLVAQAIYSIKIEAYIEYINSKKEILWN